MSLRVLFCYALHLSSQKQTADLEIKSFEACNLANKNKYWEYKITLPRLNYFRSIDRVF